MSAFVVDKAHISAMIRYGLRHNPCTHSPLRWDHNGDAHYLTRENASQVGQMLLDENIKSVSHRYPEDAITALPGRCDAEYIIPFQANTHSLNTPKAVETLKLISCYEYQSCEHPDWEMSEAHAFCEALQGATIRALPGYDEAPWEWTAA